MQTECTGMITSRTERFVDSVRKSFTLVAWA